jgi:hypothetical protein
VTRALCALLCIGFAASSARAVSFQAEFAATTYQVVLGDTSADLLAEHQTGALLASVSMTGFTTAVDLDAGSSYTLAWLGFEDCCAGVTTIRFSYEGRPFQILNESNLDPLTAPEPHPALLAALGLVLLAMRCPTPRA